MVKWHCEPDGYQTICLANSSGVVGLPGRTATFMNDAQISRRSVRLSKGIQRVLSAEKWL